MKWEWNLVFEIPGEPWVFKGLLGCVALVWVNLGYSTDEVLG